MATTSFTRRLAQVSLLASLLLAAGLARAQADEPSSGAAEAEPAQPSETEVEGLPDTTKSMEGGVEEIAEDVEVEEDMEPDASRAGVDKGFVRIEVPGSFKLRFHGLSDIQVSGFQSWEDPDTPEDEILFGAGNDLGQNFYGSSRLRIAPLLNWKDLLIVKAEFDLLTGPWVGDTTSGVGAADMPRDSLYAYQLQGQRLRQLYMEINAPFGTFRVGQMTSNWGLSILAGSGEEDPVFGYYDGGDLVERVLFATKPFVPTGIDALQDLAVVVAGDLVYDDNTAEMKTCKRGKKLEYCGDLAFQVIAALMWEYKKQQLGFYWVYRHQKTDDDRLLEIMVFDGMAHGEVPFPADVTAYAEGEVAYITNKLPGLDKATMAFSVSELEGHWVEQFGASGRIGLEWREIIDFWIELGYASGDSNSLDDHIRNFTMDPSHRVGMVLFHEVLAWQSARAGTLAAHPNMVGEPVPGSELIASNGGVFGSFYFNPVLRVRPLEYLDGAVGVVVARASAEMVSPFSQKAGGAPLNYLSGPVSSKDLGVELDFALNFRYPVKGVGLGASYHFGHLWPGRYFTDASGERMDAVWIMMGRLALDW
jgi:hypothetical protein